MEGIQSNDTNRITTRLPYRLRDGIKGAIDLVPKSGYAVRGIAASRS
jgi:hypothetical protein